MTKFSEENTDRHESSSVEVEKMKIERSEAEGTHMADRETISKLRAVATLRSQSGKNDKGSEHTRPNHTTTGLALWSSLTLETRSHPCTVECPGRTSTVHGCPSRWEGCGWPEATTTDKKITAHSNMVAERVCTFGLADQERTKRS